MENFIELEKSIVDMLKEAQVKIGFSKEEIRLFYQLSSLNNILGIKYGAEEMKGLLNDFVRYSKDRLGDILISEQGERFCFNIPVKGVVYAHENTAKDEFIKELVDIIKHHGCTMEEIKNLFLKKSDNIHFENIKSDEFDYLIYFNDIQEDKYYYCFKDEGFHITYHRFIPKDFEEFDL